MKIALKKHRSRAFTLMEVMIAIAVFFMAIFAILELTSRNLKMARALQQPIADPGAVAAQVALTNQLEDAASESGDLGPEYPGAQYTWTASEVSSNGLFRVDIVVSQPIGGRVVQTPLSVLMFRPEGAPQAGGATTTQRQNTRSSTQN